MHISQATREFWCFWVPVRGTTWRYIPDHQMMHIIFTQFWVLDEWPGGIG